MHRHLGADCYTCTCYIYVKCYFLLELEFDVLVTKKTIVYIPYDQLEMIQLWDHAMKHVMLFKTKMINSSFE